MKALVFLLPMATAGCSVIAFRYWNWRGEVSDRRAALIAEAAKLRPAMVKLIASVGYADDQWLRETDAFAEACTAAGIRRDRREGLFDGEARLSDPEDEE